MKYGYLWLFFTFHFFGISSIFAQQQPVDLFITDNTAYIDEEVKLDISVNGFTNIISFQASVNWDPALLAFKSVSNFGIGDFDITDLGVTEVDLGHLRFIWTPQDAKEVTAPDGTILFSITFIVLSDAEPLATVDFLDKISVHPFEIEFANADYEILKVNTTAGNITILPGATDLVTITSIPNTQCDERAFNGSLSADVQGEIENYIFRWFIGNEVKAVPDHVGSTYGQIPGGQYTLQVLDMNSLVLVEKMPATVTNDHEDTPDAIKEILNIPQQSCSDIASKLTGYIEIEVNNAQPEDTYHISWWIGNAQSGEQIIAFENNYAAEKLAKGNYEVVVENLTTGCRAYLKSVIAEEPNSISLSLISTQNNFCKDGSNGSISAEVTNASDLNLRYYWFKADAVTDTTKALSQGPVYSDIPGGNYKCWTIDLLSDCFAEATISVTDSAIYPVPIVSQRNDTLFANYNNAVWFFGNIILGKSGPYIVPDKSGVYSVSVTNQYKCLAFSNDLNFGITGLEDFNNNIAVYPNPFREFIRIDHTDGADYIKVFDSRGSLIREFFNVKEKFTDLCLSGSFNGFYLIQIKKGESILTRKVIETL